MSLNKKRSGVIAQAEKCNCQAIDCTQNHRLCALCKKIIFINLRWTWNIDHNTPKSWGGTNAYWNLQATHIECNQRKGNWID